MSAERQGILASYDFLDSTVDTIKELKKEGFEEITAFAPFPEHHIEEALGYKTSPVRMFTLIGGLTGAATGFAFTTFSVQNWPLITGGKPLVSIPAFVVIAFELTILFGALATVIGVFLNMRIPDIRSKVVYDPEFSAGRFGVYVTATGDRLKAARKILESRAPSRLEDDARGRSHG
jgi:hypothetical protein